jgi:hypothetical protein
MRFYNLLFASLVALAAASFAGAAEWITAPSYYTHDPQSGQRVTQYSPIGPVYVPQGSDYVKSGYRHTRSSLQVGNTADHVHVVEQWGAPVRPYDEWRFPYRPYSVPYQAWGPPYGGFGGGGFGPGFGYGGGVGGGAGGGLGYDPYTPGFGQPYQGPGSQPPWLDDSHPDYRSRRHYEQSDQPYDYAPHGYRPYPPPIVPPRPGAGINIGGGNNGTITIDNGVDGNGNTVGGNVGNN